MLKQIARVLYHWKTARKNSYSQTGEDRIAAFFLSEVKAGVYVDIGANDPMYLNNTYLFYRKGWRGVCVEPNPTQARLFKTIRPRDTLVRAAIGAESGTQNLYIFDPDTISTMSADVAEKYRALGHKQVRVEQVKVMALTELLAACTPSGMVDLLSVDTEGYDLEILQSNNWAQYRPKVIICETGEYKGDSMKRIPEAYDAYLLAQGYLKLADTYINGLYIDKSYAKTKGIIESIR